MTEPKCVGCPFRRDCPGCPWTGETPAAASWGRGPTVEESNKMDATPKLTPAAGA